MAMRLRDHTNRDLVFVFEEQCEKRPFLERLVGLVKEQLPGVDSEALLERLIQREEQVTTGIGHGVAIPHAMVDGLDKTCCVVVQIPGGIDYESLDASPVHVAFLLLSPPRVTGLHIRLLARIARLVDGGELVRNMARASGADEVYEALLAEDGRHV